MDDNRLVLNYSEIEYSGVGNEMADTKHNRKVLPVSLSETQLAAIETAAAKAGMNRSEYIRHIFMTHVENFPDDLAQWGKVKTPKKLGA